ncbi:MAG TPA: SAM-dependent methyltransferase [Terriglobales bacterium]|nr:SAM-dependent methyltransferase [Terriglobales bacterium]
MTLRQRIEQEILRCGPIPFSRYMELCLYDPELGYYSRNAEQFGKAGDFYTSSDVHAVFGRLLARQFNEMWRVLRSPVKIAIVELGPGRGLFAQDVLAWSEKKFPEFFRALRLVLIESSPALRNRLKERFAAQIAEGKVSVADDIDSADFGENTIVFANEFFDALPVEVLDHRGELRIGVDAGRLAEQFVAPSAAVLDYIDRYSVQPDPGERVEAPLIAQKYMARVAEKLQRGFFGAIDYGYTRDELLAGRHRGTVTAFRQHTMSVNPYEAPGEQDLTAHVNFTALRAAGEQAGLDHLALLTQAQFLMGIGEENQFADAFEDCGSRQEQTKVALQLKHLVTPAGIGETFHVLLTSRGVHREAAMKMGGLRFA